MNISKFIGTFFFPIFMSSSVYAQTEKSEVPSLDELSGQWRPTWQDEQTPAISNFHGGMQAGKNVLSITNLIQPPLSQGKHFDGGSIMELYINQKPVITESSKWYPYQVLRKAHSDSCLIETNTRMVFEDAGIVWKLKITNLSTFTRRLHLKFANKGHIRSYKDVTWTWSTPRPVDNDFKAELHGKRGFVESDVKSEAYAVYNFSCDSFALSTVDAAPSTEWNLSIEEGKSVNLEIVMSLGQSKQDAIDRANTWSKNFNSVFEEAFTKWQNRYRLAFTPNNNYFSGWLPVLKTNDASLRRIYYSSIVTFLELMRTNFSNGPYKRVFVTASPAYATTLTYYWDAISYSTVWALLDPQEMKLQLELFLSHNLKNGYAVDFLSMKQVGPWYSANEYAVFHMVYTYINITGDIAFLDEKINGITVLQKLEEIAMAWKQLTDGKSLLADYGGPENVSETVHSYIHKVPFLNAANVWMMRSLAQVYNYKNEKGKTKQLESAASVLSKEVSELYVKGKGYWQCRFPDGELVPVPICIDFLTIGRCMPADLTDDMKQEMMDFVEKKLWVGNWMRALALEDESAQATLSTSEGRESLNAPWPGKSLRADHGCTGAYDGWPALTAEAFIRLGKAERGVEMLRNVAPVLDEGPFGQARYVSGEITPVRKVSLGGQDYYEGAGTAFAEVIIRALFGFDPGIEGTMIELKDTPRGFNGDLINVRFRSKSYRIVSGSKGIKTNLQPDAK
ncbi:MAG: hypothetical protein KF862_20025 [Chitinophagaceae bacterium]|nr:hypothetical protein [Chitinophagaceae bacterium]